MLKIHAFWDQKRPYIKKGCLNSTSHRMSCNNCDSYFNNLLVVPLLGCHQSQSHSVLFHSFCPNSFCSGFFRLKMHKIPCTWNSVQSWSGSVLFSGDYLFLNVNFTDEFFKSLSCCESTQTTENQNILDTPEGCFCLKLVFLLKIKSC